MLKIGILAACARAIPVRAQDNAVPTPASIPSIGRYRGTFKSPYEGTFSLQNYPERDVSFTATLFLGFRLFKNTPWYFDPEIAGGRGFHGVNGLANAPNGELPRVANQRGGSCPQTRYAIKDPRTANGPRFDRRLFVDRGVRYEYEYHSTTLGHAGTRSGSYGEALQIAAATGRTPDVTAIRRPGTLKYGFGMSFDQELAKDIGVFARPGGSDRKTEDFAVARPHIEGKASR